MKLCSAQARQPARDLAAEISARSFSQTSKERSVRRILSRAPTRYLIASVALRLAAALTAEFRMPLVSQVSKMPLGELGKTQARHAVSPGRIFMVTQ